MEGGREQVRAARWCAREDHDTHAYVCSCRGKTTTDEKWRASPLEEVHVEKWAGRRKRETTAGKER
jgi:hypothetical protein